MGIGLWYPGRLWLGVGRRPGLDLGLGLGFFVEGSSSVGDRIVWGGTRVKDLFVCGRILVERSALFYSGWYTVAAPASRLSEKSWTEQATALGVTRRRLLSQ